MIAIITLDGYSASCRKVKMSDLVDEWLYDLRTEIKDYRLAKMSMKSTMIRSRKRKIREWIVNHSDIADMLICVGKSYGAKNLLDGILPHPKVQRALLNYNAVGLLTVDANFPIWSDWTPNLNDYHFNLPQLVDVAVNVYVQKSNKRKQCGAIVNGSENLSLRGYDHYSVIHAPQIQQEFYGVLRRVINVNSMLHEGVFDEA
jgi:hypothetical protein